MTVVHERMLMPVPENLSWAEAGGTPEVFTTAHDAVFSQAEPEARRAAACPRWRRRRRHGRDPARARGRGPGHRDRAQPGSCVTGVAAFGATVIEPEGFAEHGHVRRDPRARRRAEPPGQPPGAQPVGPDRRDRDRRRREGGAPPWSADGQAGADLSARRCGPARLRRRRSPPVRLSARCCRCSPRARCGCRLPRRIHSTRSRRRTRSSSAGGKLGKIVVVME